MSADDVRDTKPVAVSVVVPTYNRSEVLARTLAALGQVNEPEGGFEVIVVDDGSVDAHASGAAAATAGLERARLLRRENGGPAAARNAGIRAAHAPLVAFLDDDCEPAPDWLVRLVEPFSTAYGRLGAVGGRVLPAPPRSWAQRFCAATEYASGIQPVFENASTANACYRRDVLDEVGGFDEGFRRPGGDDPDLSRRTVDAGYELRFAPDAVVYHSELETYRDFVRHMYHRGLGEARIGTKFGRRRRVVLRLALFPAFLAKIAVMGWRRTAPKGGVGLRLVWAVLELGGYSAFLAGTAVGLARERRTGAVTAHRPP